MAAAATVANAVPGASRWSQARSSLRSVRSFRPHIGTWKQSSCSLRILASEQEQQEIPAEIIEDSKFAPIKNDDPSFGPLALLLVGFKPEEKTKISKFLEDIDGGSVRLVLCTEEMLKDTLWNSISSQNRDTNKVAEGVPRVCFLSGMTGEEIMIIVDSFHEIGFMMLAADSNVTCPDVCVTDVDEHWAELLAAQGRAPVKREFLKPSSTRLTVPPSCEASLKISSEKKSKRQLKKERHQAKNSGDSICPAVARTGNPTACRYGEKCKFNHDLESFIAQKPSDLPGDCPFVLSGRECPFAIACRFAGTHPIPKETNEEGSEKSSHYSDNSESNLFTKEFQRLLWKNTASFLKADAQLEAMGLQNTLKEKFLPKEAEVEAKLESLSTVECTTETDLVNKELVPVCKKLKVESESIEGNDFMECKPNIREKKIIDFKNKLYLAPLTTVGNLPFRRVCKRFGADVTCGEMALCTNLLQGQASEWALLRRHSVEDLFGVQICGSHPDTIARSVELIERECQLDFIDINLGCPIDIVVNKGAGSCLLTKPTRLQQIVTACSAIMDKPLTLKMRMGYYEGRNCAHTLIPKLSEWGASAVAIHGRTRQQRYSKAADWQYIYDSAATAPQHLQVIGNGDLFSFTEWNHHLASSSHLTTAMIARGALIKPWLFTEIKEQRHWDISASERLDIIRDFVRFGLEHWGSDTKGVETTRRFLLEWLSYMHRYIPVELLEIVPQKLNWRPPNYFARNELENLMASDNAADWVRISELVLGAPPPGFLFTPKHKSNAYDKAENG